MMRFGKIDNYIMFGSGQLFANVVLEILKGWKDVLVVASERHTKENLEMDGETKRFKQFLSDNKIPYHISRDANADKRVINKIAPNTLGISIGAAWTFAPNFISRFKGRLLNVHGTRLPQNRGGGGFSWQVLCRNRLGFALIHQIRPGIDTGPIIKYEEFFYPPSCRTPGDYRKIYIEKSLALAREFLKELKANKDFEAVDQQECFSTYWPRLATAIHGFIDWSWPLRDIESFICAFDAPYKGASTFINNGRVYLKDCFSDYSDGKFHPFQKGIVYRKTEDALFVATEDGSLVVGDARDSNGASVMNKVKAGDRFYTPIKFLEKAKLYRAVYTPRGLKK